MPDPVTVEAVTKTIGYASNQSDRWLFIALLVVGGISIGFLTKWFMLQVAKAHDATAAAHAAYLNHLNTAAIEQIRVITECRLAMQEMTSYLKESHK